MRYQMNATCVGVDGIEKIDYSSSFAVDASQFCTHGRKITDILVYLHFGIAAVLLLVRWWSLLGF